MRGPDVITTDTLWWSFFFLVLRDPRADFERLVWAEGDEAKYGDYSGKVVKEAYPEDSLAARAKWVVLLLGSRPLTSWTTGDTSHDAKVSRPNIARSRAEFLGSTSLLLWISLLIVMPVSLALHRYDDGLTSSTPSSSLDPAPLVVRFLQEYVPQVVLRPLTLGAYLYSLMTLLFLPAYIIPVATNFLIGLPSDAWSPHTWPRPHFGPFSAVLDHGLRGLWGRWWHQQMRHAVAEPGRWLADRVFELPRWSTARYMLICVSAFVLSGATHMGLVPPEPRWAKEYTAWQLRLLFGAFFWVQPLGIFVEVMVLEPALSRLRRGASASNEPVIRLLSVLERTARLTWVLLFMSFAFSFLIAPFQELGYWSIWPPSVLPAEIRALLEGGWII